MLVAKLSEYCTILANENRFRILKVLVDADQDGLSLRQLSKRLRLSQSSVRNHLKCLSGLDLVLSQKQKKQTLYLANGEQITQFLDAMRFVLETDWKLRAPLTAANGDMPRKIVYKSLRSRLRQVEHRAGFSS